MLWLPPPGEQWCSVRWERCCSFLNACWVLLWSPKACGTLLPFLLCPELPVSFLCILPLVWLWDSTCPLQLENRITPFSFPSQGTKLTRMPLWSQKCHVKLNAVFSGANIPLVSQQKLLLGVSRRIWFCEPFKTSSGCLQIGDFWFWGFLLWVNSLLIACSFPIVNFFLTLNMNSNIATLILLLDLLFSIDTLRLLKFEKRKL